MKILVTGFEPFNSETINPSEEIIKRLKKSYAGNTIDTLKLPVEFKGAKERLEEAIHTLRPGAVISLGEAGGRECITFERVAINVNDARIPDNSGYQPVDVSICEEGPTAYFSTLPIRELMKYLEDKGKATRISNTAGTYVCNHVMYTALRLAEKEYKGMKAGFIHVPYMKEQTENKEGVSSMEIEDMVKVIENIVEFL